VTNVDQVAELLADITPLYGNEYDLQKQIDIELTSAKLSHVAEYRLDQHDRPDFLVFTVGDAGIAVEVKVAGTPGIVANQLRRYLEHDVVTGVILVTTIARHRMVPQLIRTEKPVRVVSYVLKGI
jgi:hypothetical protein